MPVRLNITIDEEIYRRLKKEVPPKGISAFIESAVTARFFPDPKTLDEAYKAASKETWRRRLVSDWRVAEVEDWPD